MRVTEQREYPLSCTGCQACAQICPTDAIKMKYSDDGFLYPSIDQNKCCNCGLCVRICTINLDKQKTQVSNIYSIQAKEHEVLKKSTSGGVFYYLAKEVIKQDGIVYGAVFDKKLKKVIHGSTDQYKLEDIMRSKYVQSDVGTIYKDVEEKMLNNRYVLFCGTPCQIRGLNNFLKQKKVRGRLLTIDFMCHGVPSVTFLNDFMERLEKQYHSCIENITFREKDLGWETQVVKVYFENGEIYKCKSLENYYYYYFLFDYSLRNSCYFCNEYNEHDSDLTMADDWISSRKKDDLGTSLVFVNTNLGNDALNNIADALNIYNVTDEFKDLEIYSHKKHDYGKKEKWMEIRKNNGLEYLSGNYFKKLKRNTEYKKFYNRVRSKISRIFKR